MCLPPSPLLLQHIILVNNNKEHQEREMKGNKYIYIYIYQQVPNNYYVGYSGTC